MKPVSKIKIAAPAFALVAAGSAAVVFGLPYVENGRAPAPAAVAALPAPLLAAPAAPRETAAAAAPAATAATSEAPKAAATNTPTAGPDAAKTELAGIAATIAPPPAALAADPSGPAFDLARIEKGGDAVIAGRAAPGATVDLMRNGERLDGAVADSSGQFVIVPPRLPAGNYELSLRAKSPDGQVTSSRQNVAVNVEPAAAPIQEAAATSMQPRAGDAPQTTSAISPSPSQAARQGGDAAAGRAPRTALASVAADEGAPPHAAKDSNRVVVRGDSLWRISRLTYGAGQEYALVYRANRNQIRDPNLIHPGQVLILPLKQR